MSQLSKNNDGLKKRNDIADKYKKAFQGKIKFQHLHDKGYNAHHLFVIEIDNRKACYDHLRKNNIFSQVHYIPIHTLPYYKKMGFKSTNLFNAERYYERCLSLPMFPTLTDDEQDFVIQKVLKFIDV